jgi:Flp pilus assembly protein TadG
LSLFGLIAAGGLAFDYARMAGLDSELQSAADEAALAAASQLDGTSTAITRATTAAQNLIVNQTRFANDGNASGLSITVPTLTFYSSYDQDADSGTATTSATAAKYVQVSVGTREAVYALTPIVAVFRSGNLSALAIAGLSSAICKVPPLMLCIPSETFPSTSDIGRGLRLQPGPKTGSWVPGDYGYLDFGNGASGLKTNLGANNQASNCLDNSGGISTEPGNKASVTETLNTRFDLDAGKKYSCASGTGDFCPAENVGKDFARQETVVIKNKTTDPQPANPGCGAAGATLDDFQQNPSSKGFTRDICHVNGSCTSNFGDGSWDVTSYFSANHPADTVPSGSAATRYSVYKWELTDKNTRLPSKLLNPTDPPEIDIKGANATYTFKNNCAYPQPKNAAPLVASSTQKDRRLLTVAAVDCAGLNGKGSVKVKKWIDVFLVEPSTDRTSPYSTGKEEIYVEIVGEATKPGGANAFQYYGRNRPYLLK